MLIRDIWVFVTCLMIATLLIQHQTFFYSFPPNLDKIIVVNPLAYLFLTVGIFILIKVTHYILHNFGEFWYNNKWQEKVK